MIPTITEEQRQQFWNDGYLILENVFTTDEMNDLSAKIEAYQQRHEEEMRKRGGEEGISRVGEISFTAFLAEQDEAIRDFVSRPEWIAISIAFLGPDVDLYWNQSVFKQPEGEQEFPWHQDDGYTPVYPSPYLTLWLALNDATVENGCIWALPGSHKRGRVPHQQSPIGLVCHDSSHPNQGIPLPIKAGSIAAFPSLMFHKSGVNRSKSVRKAYIVQYSQAGLRNALTDEPIENRVTIARDGQPATL